MAITGNESTPHLKTQLPGPRTKAIVRRDAAALATTTKSAPVSAVAAKGAVVEDADGNRMLDFAAGIGVLNTGHSHPHVVKAIQDQAGRLIHFAGTDFYYDQQVALAERLGAIVPVAGPTKTFYVQSGTEANEAAIKVAKAATGRGMFLAFQGAFHGRTQGSLSLTASKLRHKVGFFPSMPGVVHTPFPNPYRNAWHIDGYEEPEELAGRAIEAIEGLFDAVLPAEETAACFWEPVQGEGGYVVPPPMFPKMLRRLCDDKGILLVADEVQTGFGRTGKMFGSEHFAVQGDVVTIAKAMGSGFPIGACVFRRDLDFKTKGMHSNTYGGNVLGCAASLATLDVFEKEKLVANSARMGQHMAKRLDEIKEGSPEVGDHRGLGLMRALEFVRPGTKGPGGAPQPDAKFRDAVEEATWKRGVVILACGKNSLRFIPPLVVTKEQVDSAMDIVQEAIHSVRSGNGSARPAPKRRDVRLPAR